MGSSGFLSLMKLNILISAPGGSTCFCNYVRAVIDVMCTFLKERCFQGATHPVRVSKVVKCKEKLRKPLPPQYALELLTVYAWEQESGDTEFNTAQGFRTVLELPRVPVPPQQALGSPVHGSIPLDTGKYRVKGSYPNSPRVLLWFLSRWLRKHPQDFCDYPDVVTVKRLVDYIRLNVTSTEGAMQTAELLSMLEKQESKTDCAIIRPTTPEASEIQEMLPLRPASVAGPRGDLKPLESPAVWEPIVPVAGTEQLLNFDQCLPTSSDTLAGQQGHAEKEEVSFTVTVLIILTNPEPGAVRTWDTVAPQRTCCSNRAAGHAFGTMGYIAVFAWNWVLADVKTHPYEIIEAK
ncbi:hypothetical protein ACRRTK_008767 [Alexandromys fortis]